MLIVAAAALLCLGLMAVHSAEASVFDAPGSITGPAGWWGMFQTRHTVYAALALLALLIGARIDPATLGRKRGLLNPILLAVLFALALQAMTFIPGWGVVRNGAARWLRVGVGPASVVFQPSELVKWTTIAFLAWWCAARRGVMHRFRDGFGPPAVLTAVACGLVVVEDLGTAVLLAAVAAMTLIAGGAPIKRLLWLAPIVITGLGAALVTSPYRVRRLTTFLDPWADPAGDGYHSIQSMLAFAQGGPYGRGLGLGVRKYFVPEGSTDFVYPILAEELGLAGAGLIIVLFAILLWQGMAVVRRSPDLFVRLLCLSVTLMVVCQAVINLAVVTGSAPTKGIALPLVSAGGTGWLATSAMLGLVAGAERALGRQAGQPAAEDDNAAATPARVSGRIRPSRKAAA